MNLNFLPKDFRDILLLLKKYEVEYLIVGAWALGAHGIPRATGDLDIFAEKSDKNSINMVKALVDFGVPSEEIDQMYFTNNVIFRMGVPPFRLEIFTTISGLNFREANKNRVYLKFT